MNIGFNLIAFIIKEAATFATAFFLVFNVYHAIEIRSMTETTGIITRYEPVEVGRGVWLGREWVDVRIRMFVTHTVGGEQHEVSWPTFTGHTGMIGQQVSFFYNPADPYRIRITEDRFSWVVQLVLGFTALIFFIGFMGLGCVSESESPWLPYIIIKIFELGGASFAIWQWLSPATNAPIMLIGTIIAVTGIVASSIANFNPMLLGLTPEKPEEELKKTLFAQLISIENRGGENEGGQYVLQFRDKQGQTYSFLTSDALNAVENSTCILTVKDGKVQRFAPLSPRKLDQELKLQ